VIADPFGSDDLATLFYRSDNEVSRCPHCGVCTNEPDLDRCPADGILTCFSIILQEQQDRVDPWTTTPAEQYNRLKYIYASFWIKVVVPNVV